MARRANVNLSRLHVYFLKRTFLFEYLVVIKPGSSPLLGRNFLQQRMKGAGSQQKPLHPRMLRSESTRTAPRASTRAGIPSLQSGLGPRGPGLGEPVMFAGDQLTLSARALRSATIRPGERA